jgi:hypothetical protein
LPNFVKNGLTVMITIIITSIKTKGKSN